MKNETIKITLPTAISRGATCLFLLLVLGCTSPRRVDYELNDGYIGWVEIRFGVLSCDSARKILGGEIIEIDNSGLGCSPMEKPTTTFGHTYYVNPEGERVSQLESTGWGEGGMIWAQSSSDSDRTIEFFVGPEDRLRSNWDKRGKPGALAASSE